MNRYLAASKAPSPNFLRLNRYQKEKSLLDSPLRPLASPPRLCGKKNGYKKKTLKKSSYSKVDNPSPFPVLSGLSTLKKNYFFAASLSSYRKNSIALFNFSDQKQKTNTHFKSRAFIFTVFFNVFLDLFYNNSKYVF